MSTNQDQFDQVATSEEPRQFPWVRGMVGAREISAQLFIDPTNGDLVVAIQAYETGNIRVLLGDATLYDGDPETSDVRAAVAKGLDG
jgi:hypothetical protein